MILKLLKPIKQNHERVFNTQTSALIKNTDELNIQTN